MCATIARGAGLVHGTWVDLAAGWDITMRAVPEVALRMAKQREGVLA